MMEWQKTGAGFGPGFWQVYGTGELRHEVFGTVEKVYGGYFAAAAGGDEQGGFIRLKDAAQWLADNWRG